MAFRTLKVELKGNGPLLMHSDKTADPLNPITQEIKKLTDIRKKTDEVLIAIANKKFMAAYYTDENDQIVMPSQNLEASIKGAAKLQKKGTTVTRAVQILDPYIDFTYDGSTDPVKRWEDRANCVDARSVVVGQARVMAYRPKFNNWTVKANICFDDEQIDVDTLVGIVGDAGSKVGLCDYRPRFGRFTVASHSVA